MELITIETNSFRLILQKIDAIYSLIEDELKQKEHDKLLDNDTLCKTLKISKSTAKRLRDGGKLFYIKDKRKILYRKSDVEKYLDEHCRVGVIT